MSVRIREQKDVSVSLPWKCVPPELMFESHEASHAWKRTWEYENGVELVLGKSWKNSAGVIYLSQWRCKRHGRVGTGGFKTENRIRNVTTLKTGCKMRINHVALDRDDPTGPWEIQHVKSGACDFHNHGPDRPETLPGVRRAMNLPTPAVLAKQAFPIMSNAQLRGKIAIITGGASGIGLAIARGYLNHGAKVAINLLPGTPVPSVISEHPNLLSVEGDISLPQTATDLVAATVAKWSRLDIFVSNAGVCQFHDFLTLPPDLLTSTVSINLNGAYFAIQAAARQMASQVPQGGSIIGISSISALVGGAGQTHYTPTKAGVLSLIQSAACALGKHNIRCNALLPGTIKTALNEEDLKDDAKRRYMESRIPLGRLGVPEDMLGPAVFLASDMAAYVTGAQLLVDGGAFVNFQ